MVRDIMEINYLYGTNENNTAIVTVDGELKIIDNGVINSIDQLRLETADYNNNLLGIITLLINEQINNNVKVDLLVDIMNEIREVLSEQNEVLSNLNRPNDYYNYNYNNDYDNRVSNNNHNYTLPANNTTRIIKIIDNGNGRGYYKKPKCVIPIEDKTPELPKVIGSKKCYNPVEKNIYLEKLMKLRRDAYEEVSNSEYRKKYMDNYDKYFGRK